MKQSYATKIAQSGSSSTTLLNEVMQLQEMEFQRKAAAKKSREYSRIARSLAQKIRAKIGGLPVR